MKSIRDDLPRLKRVFLSTLVFSLAAHAYMYFTLAPSHDSLTYLLVSDSEAGWQISLGRFMQPVYWALRGRIPAPWLVGMLSILFLSASAYIILSILGIEGRLSTVLLCGILAANNTVTATNATYLYTADTYMLALLLACAGAYLWERLPKWGWLAAMPLLAVSMGLYQAYIDVAIGLALILLIRRILDGERAGALWRRALKYAASLLGGAAAYFALMKLILALTGTALSTDYNSVNNLLGSSLPAILGLIPMAYFEFAAAFLSPLRSNNTPFVLAVTALTALAGLALWVRALRRRHIRGKELAMLLLCTALLPLGLDFVYVLSAGMVHMLMQFSFVLVYAVLLLPLDRDGAAHPAGPDGSRDRSALWGGLAVLLCALMLVHNVAFANGAYFKKQLVFQSNSQYAFSIAEQIESDPAYEPGVTPVALIGDPADSVLARDTDEYFPQYVHVTGLHHDTAITYLDTFRGYMEFILGHPIVLVDGYGCAELAQDARVQALPPFPQEGFCRMIDGVMVVRLA